ncbi:MAG: STAS domain-containing protein [Lachnospiraceae bacterium]|nr:STAS domain-containing protein [Lachnospiraceae bacterium]
MDYRAMVNPTFLTAKSTLFMLAGAENEDAKRMAAALHTQDELTENSMRANGNKMLLPENEVKALLTGSSLAVEARYAALSRLLRTGGYTNLLDIACGYTPRSLYCDKAGVDYIGLDVPVVAEELQKVTDGLGLKNTHPVYMGGDATNAASLSSAADLMDGEVLISCEGLTQYLSVDEFEQLVGGIREVLLSHGGAWVTSDMGVDYEAFATAAMSSDDAVEKYQNSRRATMKASNIYNEGVGFWDQDRKLELLTGHGMKVEKLPFYHGDEDLFLLRNMPEEWKTVLLRVLEASTLWRMTADPGFVQAPSITGAKQVENLTVNYTKIGSILRCAVEGRIDTISAPTLMEIFENHYDGIDEIEVDAKKMEYISSAGLRVLMMAVK